MKARALLRTSPVALLILVAVLAAVWAVNRPAGAQTAPVDVTFVDNFGVHPDSNGYVTIDLRSVPDLIEAWATCGGAYPEGGTAQIPSQVMARKIDPRVLRLRVFNNVGRVVTTSVRINCSFDFLLPPPPPVAPTSLRQQLAKAIQQAG
jgi:hypothetical protein